MRHTTARATWRPASEAEAVGGRAVFLEWLAAVRGFALDGPDALTAWRATAPEAFAQAILAFAGVCDHTDVRAALLGGHPARDALIMPSSTVWPRAAVLAAPPDHVAAAFARMTQADLPALAAHHLLDRETTPDSSVAWSGEAADFWPLGAWLVGASVTLALRPPVADPGAG
jgi:hypothetical protein